MLKGFRDFLMRGDVIVVAVGLSVALAFSNLVKAFTDDIINPLIAAAKGPRPGVAVGQRWWRWHLPQLGSAHFRYYLLRYFYGGRVFSDRRTLQVCHGSHGQDGIWRTASNQDLPSVPLRRSEPRRNEVQALRRGYRQSRPLTKAGFRRICVALARGQRSDLVG